MIDRGSMDWKAFTIGLIELVRWPVACVVIFVLLRGPIGKFIGAVADKLTT